VVSWGHGKRNTGQSTQQDGHVCIPRKKVNADENAHFFWVQDLSLGSMHNRGPVFVTSKNDFLLWGKREVNNICSNASEHCVYGRPIVCAWWEYGWVSTKKTKPEGNWKLRKRNGRCTNHLFGACLLLLFLFLFLFLCQPTGTMYPREHIVDAAQVLAVLWVSNYMYCTQQQHPRQQHQPHVANQIPA